MSSRVTRTYLGSERPWENPITDNERAWIEFIRLASYDTDPSPTLETVQALRQIFMPHCRPAGRPENG